MTSNTQDWLAQDTDLTLVGQNLPWLQQQRQQALKRYDEVGLPGVRDEQWRYTNLRALKNNAFSFAKPDPTSNPILPTTDHLRLVLVDGFYRSDLSTLAGLKGGIIFTNLADALENHADLIEAYFGSSLPKDQHGFTALNTAYCQDGFVLIVPKGLAFKSVLEICFINTSGEPQVSHSRNLIIAHANSQCAIVERHFGDNEAVYLNNTITEIHAEDNCHIDHYKLQYESNAAFHIGGVFIKQSAHSHVKTHNIALNGLVTRNDINCELLGRGAHIEMNGLVLGSGRQHIDNHTQVKHTVANCSSDEYYRTIMDDHSRSVFRGRIIVAEDAQLSNADQQNNNLLLSKFAEADSKPQLEIYADDVKCSHGVTVGQLDQAALFYLRSRGIDQTSATALLTIAFANTIIERLKVESLRDEITQIIAGQLLQGFEG